MSHVRFDSSTKQRDEVESDNGSLQLQDPFLHHTGEEIRVNFGLLAQYKVYEMDLSVHVGIQNQNVDLEIIQSLDPDLQAKAVVESGGARILVTMYTRKAGFRPGVFGLRPIPATQEEKDSKETQATQAQDVVVVRTQATVMSKGSGTPAIKGNIKCIGSLADDDDETDAETEWQGFE